MENKREELNPNQDVRFNEAKVVDWTGTDFRPDLAFPKLTEEMIERIKPYGHEETFPADEKLYACGDRYIDMFVILEGGPNSGRLYGTVQLDQKGFILTGGSNGFAGSPYATSVPGIYAVGDVRANSVKRVASPVGEGSLVISDVHRYLANDRNQVPAEPDSTLAALRAAGNPTELRV